jgi:hypothetical protein
MAMYHGKAEPYTPPIDKQPVVDAYPRQHSISTASLPLREHSPPSSGSSSPIKSGKEEYASQWCLCKPDPKIPRPRNGESMMSAPMLNEHGKSLFLSFCDLVGIGPGSGMFTFIGFMLTRSFFVPSTAFILYRQHHQAAVVSHNPGLANPEISKIIGMQWRALTEGEKNKWRALAEVCKNNYLFRRLAIPESHYLLLIRKKKPAMLSNIQLTDISQNEQVVMETIAIQALASATIRLEPRHATPAAGES